MSPQGRGNPSTSDSDATPSISVFGGGDEGRAIAERLADGGAAISFFEEDPAVLGRTADGIETGQAILDDANSLACSDAADVSVVVVAGRTDRRNVLTAQLLRTSVGVEHVVVRVNDPAHVEAFTNAGFEIVVPDDDLPADVGAAVDRTLRRGTGV